MIFWKEGIWENVKCIVTVHEASNAFVPEWKDLISQDIGWVHSGWVHSTVETDKYTSTYTIAAEDMGPLEAVDCDIESVRYVMVIECVWRWRPFQIWPHQVTYDVVAWPIHITKASEVENILFYYRNQQYWAVGSCGLRHSRRQIRYGSE